MGKDDDQIKVDAEHLIKQIRLLTTQRDAYHRRLNKMEKKLNAEIAKQKCECGRPLIYYCAVCDK